MLSFNADIGYRYQYVESSGNISKTIFLKVGVIARHNWFGASCSYRFSESNLHLYSALHPIQNKWRYHSHVDFKFKFIWQKFILQTGIRSDITIPDEIYKSGPVAYAGLEVNISKLLPKNR